MRNNYPKRKAITLGVILAGLAAPVVAQDTEIEEVILNITIKEGFTVAYEPVWSIGTGDTPKAKDINVIHEFIKDVVQSQSLDDVVPSVLYGGSIHESNSEDFFTEKNIDGGLIGGASSDAKEFLKIVNIYSRLITQ